jgi:hypothetical protein
MSDFIPKLHGGGDHVSEGLSQVNEAVSKLRFLLGTDSRSCNDYPYMGPSVLQVIATESVEIRAGTDTRESVVYDSPRKSCCAQMRDFGGIARRLKLKTRIALKRLYNLRISTGMYRRRIRRIETCIEGGQPESKAERVETMVGGFESQGSENSFREKNKRYDCLVNRYRKRLSQLQLLLQELESRLPSNTIV